MDAQGTPNLNQGPAPSEPSQVSHLTRRLWKVRWPLMACGGAEGWGYFQTSSLAQLALVSSRWTPAASPKFDDTDEGVSRKQVVYPGRLFVVRVFRSSLEEMCQVT